MCNPSIPIYRTIQQSKREEKKFRNANADARTVNVPMQARNGEGKDQLDE
jgi:hypothetical protein